MSRELKIGVIGLGMRGGLALLAHQPGSGARLTAAADLRPEILKKRAVEWKEQHGVDLACYTDYRQMFDQAGLDAVFVLSSDFVHEEHAVAALERGIAVYLEKPMAITIAGCDRILETAFRHKVKLYVGHNMRHMDFVVKMKEIIDSGAIGQVKTAWCRHFISYGGDAYFKDWHADRTKSTGLLLQKGAHDIDVLHWLCGGFTKRVTAFGGLTVYGDIKDRHSPAEYGFAGVGKNVEMNWPPAKQTGLNPVVDVEDVNLMLMQLDNGVFASYQQCHFTPDSWRNYTVIGTEGRLENIGDFSTDCVIRLWNKRKDVYVPNGNQEIPVQLGGAGHGGGDTNIINDFLRYLREGGKPNPSPVAARNSVAAGCLATLSVRQNGMPQDVPMVQEEIKEYFQ